MKSLRILIVEDDSGFASELQQLYSEVFRAQGYRPKIDLALTSKDAEIYAKTAADNPFDFVSLDINLGDPEMTGLDILAMLKRQQSAWMVALLTGVETDRSASEMLGERKAEEIRTQLRRDAYRSFPGERLFVVEKPSANMASNEAHGLLAKRLGQIALLYEEIGRQRYVFRSIEVIRRERAKRKKGDRATPKEKFNYVKGVHWQIRFNCGEIRTLPHKTGIHALRYFLANPGVEVTPERALSIEEEESENSTRSSWPHEIEGYFESQGIQWTELPESSRSGLIKSELAPRFIRYKELRTQQERHALTAKEEAELKSIRRQLGSVAELAEKGYQRGSPSPVADSDEVASTVRRVRGEEWKDLHLGRLGNYDRGSGRRGFDSKEANLFRARMLRLKDYFRENGFSDLAKHIEGSLKPGGAKWSYEPSLGIEWTTT